MSDVNTNIVSSLKSIIGDDYPVITAYDAEAENECTSVVAINIVSMEDLENTGVNDYKVSLSVNGQTLASEDKDKSTINTMFKSVINKLKESSVDDWSNDIGNVVNFSIDDIKFVSDGDSHNWEIGCTLIVCDLVF